MLRLLTCITQEHDLRLVVLAGITCMFATNTAFNLFAHAAVAAPRARLGWLMATGTVTGGGVWATHFIAMLAFQPNMPVGYDLELTVLSVLIAIVITTAGYALSKSNWNTPVDKAVLGGVVIGLGVFSMHYTGMAAVRVPAQISYDPLFVIASLAFGASFAAFALHKACKRDVGNRYVAGSVLGLGIVLLHFTGMAGAELTPDPTIEVPAQAMSPEWLALGIAACTIVIIGAALTASIIDQRFASLAHREAERLRALVTELERTKGELELTGENLKTALAEASSASRAKTQFLATMSHELRTPLNAVIGFADLLTSGAPGKMNQDQIGYVNDIRNSGAHLLALVNDILDISRLDANAVQLQEQEFDLSEVVAEAITMVKPKADQASVVLTTECETAQPYLRGDARRVRQILLNLLSNSVKFTPTGGKIDVTVAERGDSLFLMVNDTGIGIAAKDIPVALSPFGQVDGRLARKYEGSGLGLPLAKRLVELHGGTLGITSQEGTGTQVTVTFPAQRTVQLSQAA